MTAKHLIDAAHFWSSFPFHCNAITCRRALASDLFAHVDRHGSSLDLFVSFSAAIQPAIDSFLPTKTFNANLLTR
jgi:hypothetical protein